MLGLVGFVVFLIVGVVLAIWADRRKAKRRQWAESAVVLDPSDVSAGLKPWVNAAIRLGVVPTSAMFMHGRRITGELHGIQFDVKYHPSQSSGGHRRRSYVIYTVDFDAVSPPVTFRRERGWMPSQSIDLEVNDEAFDAAVIIDGSDALGLGAYLTPVRKATLVDLFHRHGGAKVTERSIRIKPDVLHWSEDDIVSMVNGLVEVALILSTPTDLDLERLENEQDRNVETDHLS